MTGRTNILHDYNATHSEFLHAMGEAGTEMLLQLLQVQGFENVIEFGCGTGGTLVKLKSRYPELKLAGIDASETMIKTASNRLRFCMLQSRIPLYLLDATNSIPSENTDLIFAESVLGILDRTSLQQALALIRRMLKPGGRLALNDSIWRPGVSPEEIDRINEFCLQTQGIILCNQHFHGLEKIRDFFQQHGFILEKCIGMEPDMPVPPTKRTWKELLSRFFTLAGKYLQPGSYRSRMAIRKTEMTSRSAFEPGKTYICGTLMLLHKSGA